MIDSLTSFVDPIVGNEDGAKECTDGELVDNEEIVSIDHTDRDMMCPYLPLPDTYYDLQGICDIMCWENMSQMLDQKGPFVT